MTIVFALRIVDRSSRENIFSYIIIMRSTHASFVENRICLARPDFLAPSGLQGVPRGHEGAEGGGRICMQKTRRSVFLNFVLRVMHAKVKNI